MVSAVLSKLPVEGLRFLPGVVRTFGGSDPPILNT